MNALKKILNNLQKYATTVTAVKNDNAFTPLLPEKRSLEETDLHNETLVSEIGVNAATRQTISTDECLKEFDDILEEINKDVTKGTSLDDVDEVLKDMTQEDPKDFVFEVPRFDLAEISAAFEYLKDDDVDINSLISFDDSVASLSDGFIANINEVIEQNDVISISSEDSQPEDSIQNILTANTGNIEQHTDVNSTNNEETKGNRKHSNSIECQKLNNKYISDEKYQGIENQTTSNEINDVEAKTNEHSDETNEPTDKTNEPTDKTNEGVQNNPVENCQEVNDRTIKDDSDDCGYQSSDFEFITEEEAKMVGLIIKFKKNTHKRKADEVNRVKTIAVSVDQFSNEKISPRRKKIKRKTRNIDEDPDWAPESDIDSISDDEFVPDDMESLCGNNTRSKNNNTAAKSPGRNNSVTFSLRQIRIPPRTNNSSPRLRNFNSDSQSRNITEFHVIKTHKNEERDSPNQNNDQEFRNECRNELATIKMDCKNESHLPQIDLKTAQINYPNANFNHVHHLVPENVPNSNKRIPGSNFMQDHPPDYNNMVKNNDIQVGVLNFKLNRPETVPDSNKIILGSRFMQENNPDSNNMVIKTNEMQDEPDLKNIRPTLNIPEENNPEPIQRTQENTIPGTSRENVPNSNNLNPGPSGIEENLGSGPSCKRNRSHIDEIEKWRMYQMRNRLNRHQFIVDYSYRDHHSIYQDNDLYQLFDPNHAPLPTARSIRLLENKSTVCKNSMLVEYQGLGFNVQLRGDSGSEDDEVIQEAYECAQKILEMYPGPNTRRERHRRF